MWPKNSLVSSVILLAVNFFHVGLGNEENQNVVVPCVPLPECPSLFLLLKQRDNLPNFSRRDIYRHLTSQHCGFDDKTPLVKCIPEDLDTEEVNAPRFGGGGGVIDFETESTCSGSVTIVHTVAYSGNRETGESDPTTELRRMRTAKLRRQRYPNLFRRFLSDERKVLHIETSGNCCWKIHYSANFRGQGEFLRVGYSGLPNNRVPKSLKKVSCAVGKE